MKNNSDFIKAKKKVFTVPPNPLPMSRGGFTTTTKNKSS